MDVDIIRMTGTEMAADPARQHQVLTLDEANMSPILAASGVAEFPWEKRRANLLADSTVIFLALDGDALVGYSEFGLGATGEVYLSSIQIPQAHRGGPLAKMLLRAILRAPELAGASMLRSNVQRENRKMIGLFEALGFTVSAGRSSSTLDVQGTWESIRSSPLGRALLADK